MLKDRMFTDSPPEELEQILRDSCEGVKNDFIYTKQLTEEELKQKREQKVNNDIELARRQTDLKDYIAKEKKAMEPYQDENVILLDAIRDRVERTNGTAYIFRDDESRMLGYYNEFGELIFSRMLTIEERQGSILSEIYVGK